MEYCAFLRGVNVKGTNMKMADVCRVFEDTGMDKVSSVLASGNIIFSSGDNTDNLKSILEKAMSSRFNYDASLFILSELQIAELIKNNPYEQSNDLHIYIFIGNRGVEEILLKEFQQSLKTELERGKIVKNAFYWQVPKGNTLDSTFGKVLGKKSLKDQFTSRNINTIEKILKKMS
ncbi:protein of unknown function DUF1697 [Pseudopedobacter saltans DSM 12145]|uniref:DUF1697 domain-containing protein n=1 Tax=Pseudopedobacter saltans (strain ATCC 51119 / DSM 12145 / JCM 21818 / CCUG 39354 / LMG 10337 / NBRC 100064 / NCIMB 13643) TaxID=762903 RepID=F0S8S2_PSESL|nr:DUF1697 domain-containing protein [Pseudopedobacter saltans]ADY52403.1 protein of unknown function DUF1697 [Pseudopedobacter saltans DSM 12145]